jgi:hypothetical protein
VDFYEVARFGICFESRYDTITEELSVAIREGKFKNDP